MIRKESGQSLLECLFVIPLFFIVLSGVMFVFYQQIRNVTDDWTNSSLKMSQAFFDQEEKRLAKWSGANEVTENELKNLAYNSLNPSVAFSSSTDMKEGVLFDKKKIILANKKGCSKENSYFLSVPKDGVFDFSTCASEQAYERASFFFDKDPSQFHSTAHSYSGRSLYYPSVPFSWNERAFEAGRDSHEFLLSGKGILFSNDYASLSLPFDRSDFNSGCFMAPFSPQCHLHPMAGKFERAAKDGANTQLFECFAEMTGKCLLLGVPHAIALCEAQGIQSITFALEVGQKAPVCPITNTATSVFYQSIKVLVHSNLIKNSTNEIKMRTELLKK